MITIYDAARCPYCARVRIVLGEKSIPWESFEIDLADRPGWLYEKNPKGKVPVLEEDGFVLPESHVIMEYLEERYPEPALLPADPAERALARLAVDRFDALLRCGVCTVGHPCTRHVHARASTGRRRLARAHGRAPAVRRGASGRGVVGGEPVSR